MWLPAFSFFLSASEIAYERFQIVFPEGKHEIIIVDREDEGYDLYIGGHISNDGSSYDHGEEELLEEDYNNYKIYLEFMGYEIVYDSIGQTGGLHYVFYINVK